MADRQNFSDHLREASIKIKNIYSTKGPEALFRIYSIYKKANVERPESLRQKDVAFCMTLEEWASKNPFMFGLTFFLSPSNIDKERKQVTHSFAWCYCPKHLKLANSANINLTLRDIQGKANENRTTERVSAED